VILEERWMELSAGQGPAECCWAVACVPQKLVEEARAGGLGVVVLSMEPEKGTAQSAPLAVAGESAGGFSRGWQGTVQWIGRSPFRAAHKRKNWFVGVRVMEQVGEAELAIGELRWETMRASGPGGQHVNRMESAVRVTHVATGIQAVGRMNARSSGIVS
jgi:peptide chain release factor